MLLLALGGCAVLTQPLAPEERERLAEQSRRELFDGQEPLEAPLTLAEATARAIKYQADHRQRRMEEAAAAAQVEVAKFDLLPSITANAGYSWRSNDAFGFGFTPEGTIATTPSASVERNRSTASLGLAWNLLDFGVSYFRARQLSDQKLVAEERRRKAVQTLMHDVRIAWWRAETAERLLPAADRLLAEIEKAIEKTRFIEARRLLPPVQTATLRRALLDLGQQIALRRQDLMQARIELAALIGLPPGAEFRLAAMPSEAREVQDLAADMEALEGLALRMRPEIAEEGYRARISQDEARKAMVAVLPGVSLDLGRNYDSNRFLLNNAWTSAGLNVAFNLVKAFSLPALQRSEAAQKKADDARRLAMATAVLVQTRLAAVRYSLVADEFLIWDEAVRDDDLIVQHLAASEKVGVDNELELIRSRARALASRINRDLAYANLQASVARLYNSVGYDAVPREDEALALGELTRKVEGRFAELERTSFAPRVPQPRITVAVGEVSGAEPGVAALLAEGLGRALDAGGFATKAPDAAGSQARDADVRLELRLLVADPKDGGRTARVLVSAMPRGSATASSSREFRTTLSEPVDDEQWRVLGEGAAYRVLPDLASRRITRTVLRVAERLGERNETQAGAGAQVPLAEAGGPLPLRAAAGLRVLPEESSTGSEAR